MSFAVIQCKEHEWWFLNGDESDFDCGFEDCPANTTRQSESDINYTPTIFNSSNKKIEMASGLSTTTTYTALNTDVNLSLIHI